MKIKNLKVRPILATNCKKTIEVEVETENMVFNASVPMGTSVGKHEVNNLSVEQVLKIFSRVKKQFIGKTFESQREVDTKLREIDGTKNFSKIGGNLALGISSACFKVFFEKEKGKGKFKDKKMPRPLCNVAGAWGKESEIQEFLLLPNKQRAFNFKEEIFRIARVYRELGDVLKRVDKNFMYGKNYESGWITTLQTNMLMEILSELCGRKLSIGVDVAASDRWDGKLYVGGRNVESQMSFISELIEHFNLVYIEDPFHEDDFNSFSRLTETFRDVLICGDDLFTTNVERLKIGIDKGSTNTVLVKPNQIGTITDTIEFVNLAKENGMKTVMSHRSGTTEETLVCYLAVMLDCDFVKFGIAGERIIKINEMMRIEDEMLN